MTRSLLTVVFAAVLAVGAWQLAMLTSEQAALRRELAQLQPEVGVLEIGDPSLIHVVSVPTGEPLHWRWRVYEPKDIRTAWTVRTGAFARDGSEGSYGGSSTSHYGGSDARQYLVDAAIVVEDGAATFVELSPTSASRLGLSGYPDLIDYEDPTTFDVEVAGTDGTLVVERQETLQLLRAIGHEPDPDRSKEDRPLYPGVELLIQDIEPAPVDASFQPGAGGTPE